MRAILYLTLLCVFGCAIYDEERIGEAGARLNWCCDVWSISDEAWIRWCGDADTVDAAAGKAAQELVIPPDDPTGGTVIDTDTMTCHLTPPLVVLDADGYSWVGAPLGTDDITVNFADLHPFRCYHQPAPVETHELKVQASTAYNPFDLMSAMSQYVRWHEQAQPTCHDDWLIGDTLEITCLPMKIWE